MKVSIVYITSRREPKWEWFIDSLCAQTTEEQRAEMQLIFVDGWLWNGAVATCDPTQTEICLAKGPHLFPLRLHELERAIAGRFPDVLHIPPKPCAYQGPFRQTSRDFFAAGSARNTAVIVAKHSYLAFIDDLSCLGPLWYDQVCHAAQDQYVVCGMYKKLKKMVVVDGRLESFEEYPGGVDSRWPHGSDGGVVPWHGTGMFGCSFGVPLEAMLEVDGNDSAAVTQGGEDYDLGMRLDRASWAFFLNRNMLSFESEELHHNGSNLPRERKLVTPDRLPKGYDSYQVVNQEERYFSDHVMLNRLANETDRILPVIGDNLRAVREHFLRTGLVPIPQPEQRDWRDGKLLKDL